MAEKRMFAKSIVLSDAFIDMPMSARCLYFTMGMLADDDGFVSAPKSIMRQCGASQDDMAILIQKRYVLAFESGVIVIKHWRINNYLRQDRYTETTYLEEKSTLTLDAKGAYTELGIPVGIPSGNPVKNSIEKNSVDKNRVEKTRYAENVSMTDDEYQKLIDKYGESDTARLIEILDNYKGSSGKSYKSDYRAILNWVVDRLKEERTQKQGKAPLQSYQGGSEEMAMLRRLADDLPD